MVRVCPCLCAQPLGFCYDGPMQHEAQGVGGGPENDDGGHEPVEIVTRVEGGRAVVRVRALRSRAVLLSIRSVDEAGAAFAVLSAERFCAERGLVLVMRMRRAA